MELEEVKQHPRVTQLINGELRFKPVQSLSRAHIPCHYLFYFSKRRRSREFQVVQRVTGLTGYLTKWSYHRKPLTPGCPWEGIGSGRLLEAGGI